MKYQENPIGYTIVSYKKPSEPTPDPRNNSTHTTLLGLRNEPASGPCRLRQRLQTEPKLGQVLVPAPVWLGSSSVLIQTLCLEASGVAKLGWWHLPGIPEVSHPPELPSAPNAQRSAAAAERSPGSPGA